MGFTDDFPLNPPPLPDDWSKPEDRNQYDSLQEVRANMRIFAELVDGLHREDITLPDGRRVTTLLRESGRDDTYLGFAVYPGASGRVRVWPSVVSGIAAASAVPVISGTSLATTPPPELSVPDGAERWIALRMEIDPDSEEIPTYPVAEGEPVPDPVYRILEGGGTLTTGTSIEVRVYADEAAMDAAARLPIINSADGSVTQSAIYVIPLAKVFSDGSIEQLGYYGPIGVRMCASGAAVVLGPAVGVLNA